MILDKIISRKIIRVNERKEKKSLDELIREACEMEIYNPSLYGIIRSEEKLSVISEIKKASPSKGIISEEFNYLQTAQIYEKSGAAGISVLTEEDFFLGSDRYLTEIRETVSIPVLRKDFIVDEYQLYEAKIIGADAVLLICAVLEYERLKKFLKISHELGLECLVETHDEYEVENALRAGAEIIGVNNRNLRTFDVDLKNSVNLFRYIPNDIIRISESGVNTYEDAVILKQAGADAVLVGEALMKSDDIAGKILELKV